MMNQKKRVLIKGVLVTTLAVAALWSGISPITGVHAANNSSVVQTSVNQKHAKLLQHTKELAKQGKVTTTEKDGIGIGTSRKEIEKKWGKPTEKLTSEDRYDNRSTTFLFDDDKKETVYWIFTTDKNYRSISYEELKRTLGKPSEESHDDVDKNAYQLVYKTGKYELNFEFQKKNGKMGNIQLVHVVDRSKVG